MIYKIKYRTPRGDVVSGLFLETIYGYKPVEIHNNVLDKANKIIEKKAYMTLNSSGVKAALYSQGSKFSQWIRELGTDGLCVADFDWVFWNFKTKDLMLLEEKRGTKDFSNEWLRRLKVDLLEPGLREACLSRGIKWHGYNFVQFENNSPTDGKIFFSEDFANKREISEQQLKDILTFK